MEKITKPPFKVVITGPESTGKSTLSRELSQYFDQPWLPEYARTYLTEIDRPYAKSDLVEIAKGQIDKENELISSNVNMVFFDTSLEVLKVWSEWKYKTCDNYILSNLKNRPADFYLLLTPDMTWENDPMRENPDDRQVLFDIYKSEIEKIGRAFQIISGLGRDRTTMAVEALSKLTIQ